MDSWDKGVRENLGSSQTEVECLKICSGAKSSIQDPVDTKKSNRALKNKLVRGVTTLVVKLLHQYQLTKGSG